MLDKSEKSTETMGGTPNKIDSEDDDTEWTDLTNKELAIKNEGNVTNEKKITQPENVSLHSKANDIDLKTHSSISHATSELAVVGGTAIAKLNSNESSVVEQNNLQKINDMLKEISTKLDSTMNSIDKKLFTFQKESASESENVAKEKKREAHSIEKRHKNLISKLDSLTEKVTSVEKSIDKIAKSVKLEKDKKESERNESLMVKIDALLEQNENLIKIHRNASEKQQEMLMILINNQTELQKKIEKLTKMTNPILKEEKNLPKEKSIILSKKIKKEPIEIINDSKNLIAKNKKEPEELLKNIKETLIDKCTSVKVNYHGLPNKKNSLHYFIMTSDRQLKCDTMQMYITDNFKKVDVRHICTNCDLVDQNTKYNTYKCNGHISPENYKLIEKLFNNFYKKFDLLKKEYSFDNFKKELSLIDSAFAKFKSHVIGKHNEIMKMSNKALLLQTSSKHIEVRIYCNLRNKYPIDDTDNTFDDLLENPQLFCHFCTEVQKNPLIPWNKCYKCDGHYSGSLRSDMLELLLQK